MELFAWVSQPEAWVALATLTVLELVLGIDNIIFISILAGKLPEEQRNKAWKIGLTLAMGVRILLLASLSWVIRLDGELFSVFGHGFSGRDLILAGGGLFLLGKATREIHHSLEGIEGEVSDKVTASLAAVLAQIMVLDIVFSLDSVITAVGMADDLMVMIIAVVIAVIGMMFFAQPVGDFVEDHPTVKMLALSFLLLVGMTLVADGLGHHVPKGYIYFAMGFSVLVEALNLKLSKNAAVPVDLREAYAEDEEIDS